MVFEKRKSLPMVWRLVLTGALVLSLLTGCGKVGEYTTQAVEYMNQMEYDSAIEALDVAEEEGENMRQIHRMRGIAYMGKTWYAKAASCFEAANQMSDGILRDMDFDISYYLAAAYTKNGKHSDALRVYDAILSLRPREKEVHFLRGNVHMALGNYEDACADFEKTIQMAPTDYDQLIKVYEALSSFGYEEKGKTYLREVLKQQDKKMDPFVVGRIYYYLGEYQNACLTLEQAKKRSNPDSYLYLGKAYEATGDFNYAASVYEGFLREEGSNARIYNQLGLCEMARKDYTRALDAFQSGLEMEEKDTMQVLSFNEIVAYEHLGDYEQALSLTEQYLKKYPDDMEAKREYEFLLTR